MVGSGGRGEGTCKRGGFLSQAEEINRVWLGRVSGINNSKDRTRQPKGVCVEQRKWGQRGRAGGGGCETPHRDSLFYLFGRFIPKAERRHELQTADTL